MVKKHYLYVPSQTANIQKIKHDTKVTVVELVNKVNTRKRQRQFDDDMTEAALVDAKAEKERLTKALASSAAELQSALAEQAKLRNELAEVKEPIIIVEKSVERIVVETVIEKIASIECSICMSDMSETSQTSNMHVGTCGHVFCRGCITRASEATLETIRNDHEEDADYMFEEISNANYMKEVIDDTSSYTEATASIAVPCCPTCRAPGAFFRLFL